MFIFAAAGYNLVRLPKLLEGAPLVGFGAAESVTFFTWSGFDEMEEVTGDGTAERLDCSVEIASDRHLGDEVILKAAPAPSPTVCSPVSL